MHALTLGSAVRAWLSRRAACAACGGTDLRRSRTRLSGPLAGLLAPHRCRGCGAFVALPGRLATPNDARALEFDGPPVVKDAPAARPRLRSRSRVAPVVCPVCGSLDATLSLRHRATFKDRVLARDVYRCHECKQRFEHTRERDLAGNVAVAALVVILVVLGTTAAWQMRRDPKGRWRAPSGPAAPPALR